MKIVLFAPPFAGHLNVLLYLNEMLSGNHNVLLIITGWTNVIPNLADTIKTDNIVIINDSNIESPDPMNFTLNRVNNLSLRCIEICKQYQPTLIIYDFFSLEGFVTAKTLGIAHYCSIPAMIGPFNKVDKFFTTKLNDTKNKQIFNEINDRYNVDLLKCNIQQVSDGMLIPSDVNILWSYDKVISCDNYLKGRGLTDSNFINLGPRKPKVIDIVSQKKIIYVSFGTVVTRTLWDKNPNSRPFLRNILMMLNEILGSMQEYKIIISPIRPEFDVDFNSNFKIHNHINQINILRKATLFITHCGGNGFSEAIQFGIPMIGIPFFGDQHLIGNKINKLKLGIAFVHDTDCISTDDYISTENNIFFRKSLTKEALKLAINSVIENRKMYSNNIISISQNTGDLQSIFTSFYNYPLTWKNGDLMYGTNDDRNAVIDYFGLDDEFRTCRYLPFSQLFSDKTDHTMTPRIIDIYNDALLDNNYFPVESTSLYYQYSDNLKSFKEWLKTNNKFLAPAYSFENITDDNKKETIWNICVGGIEFFTQIKQYNIHFVFENFKYGVNLATTKEVDYIKDNWNRLCTRISFYRLDTKYGVFKKIPPCECL